MATGIWTRRSSEKGAMPNVFARSAVQRAEASIRGGRASIGSQPTIKQRLYMPRLHVRMGEAAEECGSGRFSLCKILARMLGGALTSFRCYKT